MTDAYVPAQLGDVANTDVPLPHVQHRARMENPTDVLAFVLAGNSRFTLRSAVSGERFTFKVSESRDGRLYFVSLLSRSSDLFIYCGVINRHDYEFRFTRGSKVSTDAPSMIAFQWFWGWLLRRQIKDTLEFWHEGSCGRCGRALTVPESIIRGLGPTCAKKAA